MSDDYKMPPEVHFFIEAPGRYRMQNGEMAVVDRVSGSYAEGVDERKRPCGWHRDTGFHNAVNETCTRDIVAVWSEA